MTKKNNTKLAAGPVTATVVAAGVYLGFVRPRILRWGATREEASKALPGDELVAKPRGMATRAITINASAGEVWPWLVQIGQGRGGFYSYDWLENLVGCDIHNAERVFPQFQDLKVGDPIRLFPPPARPGPPDLAFKVAILEPEHSLVLQTPGTPETNFEAGLPFATWAFILESTSENSTRLIVRFRSDFKPTLAGRLANQVLLEPIHFLMERKLLLGLKARAERPAVTSRESFGDLTEMDQPISLIFS